MQEDRGRRDAASASNDIHVVQERRRKLDCAWTNLHSRDLVEAADIKALHGMEEHGEEARIEATETRKDDQHDPHLKEYKD